ncbi:MAG: hypothetical protein IKQ41_00805 [Clostridia bacterium]|nr:hypothetical protein [Clostridia bacterium]
MTGQTKTAVHSPAQEENARWAAFAKEQSVLAALGVFAQMLIGMSLYLYANVGTPGYLSILLTAPYAFALLASAKALAKRGIARAALAGERKTAARVLCLLFAVLIWADALLLLISLCAMFREFMPRECLAGLMAAVAITAADGVRTGKRGLPHLARFLVWVIFALLFFCAASAYPHGRIDHVFPLLGHGAKSVFLGGAWMCGCVCGCVWPLLMADESPAVSQLTGRRSPLCRTLWAALICAVLLHLTADWLMPMEAMQRPETLGWRVLLLANMTPSIPAWSMLIAGLTLLFLLALQDCALRFVRAFSRFAGTEKGGFWISLFLLLPMIPIAIRLDLAWLDAVTRLSAWRAVLTPVLLVLTLLLGRKSKREGSK